MAGISQLLLRESTITITITTTTNIPGAGVELPRQVRQRIHPLPVRHRQRLLPRPAGLRQLQHHLQPQDGPSPTLHRRCPLGPQHNSGDSGNVRRLGWRPRRGQVLPISKSKKCHHEPIYHYYSTRRRTFYASKSNCRNACHPTSKHDILTKRIHLERPVPAFPDGQHVHGRGVRHHGEVVRQRREQQQQQQHGGDDDSSSSRRANDRGEGVCVRRGPHHLLPEPERRRGGWGAVQGPRLLRVVHHASLTQFAVGWGRWPGASDDDYGELDPEQYYQYAFVAQKDW